MELRDAMNWAADIVNTAINMRAHTRLSGAALRLWDAAIPLFESKNLSIEHRQAIKLCLDALIMQPEVLAWVAREARDHFVKVEAAETGAPQAVPEATEPAGSYELKRIVESIQDLLVGAMDGGCYQHLPPAANAMFCAGMELSEGAADEYPFKRRAGYLMSLTALLQAPEVMTQVVQALRRALLAADPALAPLAGDVTPLDQTR